MDNKIFFLLYNIIKNNKRLHNVPEIIIRISTFIISILYIGIGMKFILDFNFKRLDYFVIPLCAFIFTTVLRNVINRPRPFDMLDITPFLEHKSGKSFPSRHTVSGMIMSFAILTVNIPLGLLALIFSLILAISRIMAGVHYPSDILGAFGVSAIFACYFWFVRI